MLRKDLKRTKKSTLVTAVAITTVSLASMTSIAYATSNRYQDDDRSYRTQHIQRVQNTQNAKEENNSPSHMRARARHLNESQHLRLQSLLQEHAVVAAQVTVNRYDNRPEFEASRQLAEQNAQLLTEEVGRLYGQDVQGEFLELWKRHLVLFVQYTDALKNNDQNLKNQTVSELNEFADELSHLLAEKTGLPREDIRQELQKHVELEQAVIDAHAAGAYNTQYQKMHEGHEHAGMMADKLAQKSSR
jgi:hypothetical protein